MVGAGLVMAEGRAGMAKMGGEVLRRPGVVAGEVVVVGFEVWVAAAAVLLVVLAVVPPAGRWCRCSATY